MVLKSGSLYATSRTLLQSNKNNQISGFLKQVLILYDMQNIVE